MNLKFSPGSLKSTILVLIQFLCIGIFAFSGKVIPQDIYLISVLLLFLFVAAWSMFIMKFQFNAAPDILPGVTLKRNGPYKYIRHPMYTSLFGLAIIWLINEFSYIRLVTIIILFIDLFIKMNYEEKLLSQKFSDYSEYKKNTKKLIPFIF